MGQDISLLRSPSFDLENQITCQGQILDIHIDKELSKWKLKALVMERRVTSYCRGRTVLGAPVVKKITSTLEEFRWPDQRENEGFPLPSTEQELKAFDDKIFIESARQVEVNLREKQRAKSASDLTSLKTKLPKLPAPTKPKFLERLFNNVSKKSSKRVKNGLIIHAGNLSEQSEEVDEQEDHISESGEECGEVEINPLVDSERTKQEDLIGSELSDTHAAFILDSTSDFSPTSHDQTWSTPNSPRPSIVRQRLNDFQRLTQKCRESQSTPSSPQFRSRTIVKSGDRILLFPGIQDKKRIYCCAFSRNEYFCKSVMNKGYVKALVEQINDIEKTGKNVLLDNIDENETETDDNNSLKPDSELRHNEKLKQQSRTPQGSPRLPPRRDKSHNGDLPSSARNSVRSSEYGASSSDCTSSSGHDRTEEESGIASDGSISVIAKQWIDESWSGSDMSFDEFDEFSECESDIDNQESFDKGDEKTPEDKLHRIALELLDTEKSYVTKLCLLDQVFQKKVREDNQTQNFLPPDVIPQMFSNVGSIYSFHNDFLLPQLKERIENWSSSPKVGDLMKRNAPFLKLYSEYVKNFDNAMTLINTWTEKSPKFAGIIAEIQKTPECGLLTLQHHMLCPIQRVPRYELLLKDYLKHLPEDSPDQQDATVALELVTKAAGHSNEAMKKIEKFHKLLEIKEKFGTAIDLISPTRELIKEGRITKISARGGERQDRYLFLFNDLMLICSEPLLGNYKLKAQLEMDGMEVMERTDKCLRWILEGENIDIPNTFYVKSRQKMVQFLDENSNGESSGWCESIKTVISDFRCRKQSLRGAEIISEKEHESNHEELGKVAPRWIKDDEVTMCMQCMANFTAFRRRHHCRSCGIVICGKCSSKKVALPYDNNRCNRVCDKCFGILKSDNDDCNCGSTPTKTGVKQRKANEPSVLSGYLHFSTDKGKSWGRRWIVAQKDFVLYTYKAHQDICALSTLPLPGYSVSEVTEDDHIDKENSFKLCHVNDKTHFFYSESANSKERWLQVLSKMVQLELPEVNENRLSNQSTGSNGTNSASGDGS